MSTRLAALAALLLAGCQPTVPGDDAPLPDRATIAAWPAVTEKPVAVSQALWFLCMQPTPDEQKRMDADLAEHGPHATWTILVRTDPASADAFRQGKPMPVGSVVVKEKYLDANGTGPLYGYTLMVKRQPGYDPDHGDWQYADVRMLPQEEAATTTGKLPACVECHAKAKDRDYLYRTYLTGRGP